LRDPRAVARASGASLEAPGVARCRKLGLRAVVVDQSAALLRVALVQEARDRYVDLLRVAKESLAVCRGELERLDVAVEELERARPERGDVVPLKDVERHWNERALRPGTAG